MTLLLRAIVAGADASVAPELGLLSVAGPSVAALATAWDGTLTAGEPELLDHHRVIQAIFERVPCLPARFGSVFEDDDALRARLADRERELASQLRVLGHRCELAITCAWREAAASDVAPAPAGRGRAYLERGLERTRDERLRRERAEGLAARLLSELGIEQAFIRHRTCPRPAVAVSMSALVTRDEIGQICSRLERLGAQLPDVTMVVQGPWAPYTFAVTE
jgi:hypothetical protein